MIAMDKAAQLPDEQRIVMTAVGLTSPNGNDLESDRESLLQGKSGVQPYEIRYVGETLAGVCDFPATQYPIDARGESEVAFEEALYFDRRGGYPV